MRLAASVMPDNGFIAFDAIVMLAREISIATIIIADIRFIKTSLRASWTLLSGVAMPSHMPFAK